MRKIAFIKIGRFSGINEHVYRMLQKGFPGRDIDVVDLWQDLLDYGSWRNKCCAIREFGAKVLLHNYGTAALRTGYAFETARRRLREQLAPEDYVFTFQTQSLFDFSLDHIPHFVYTDGTHLSMLAQMPVSGRNVTAELVSLFREEYLKKHNPRWPDIARHAVARAIIRENARDQAKLALEKNLFDHAAKVFVFSTDVRKILLEQYGCPSDKCVCAWHGSSLSLSAGSDPDRYDRKNILFVGREWERKGGPFLAAAFLEVRKRHPGATLTIVGCSPPLKEDNITVVGRLPFHEMPVYYQRASVFCMPSRLEPFGKVFIEALAFGLPIVGTRVGAIPDFVNTGVNAGVNAGQNGYLVPPDDIDELTAALDALLSDRKKCRRFGRESRKIAQERYTWENTGRIIKTHIEAVLAAGRS